MRSREISLNKMMDDNLNKSESLCSDTTITTSTTIGINSIQKSLNSKRAQKDM